MKTVRLVFFSLVISMLALNISSAQDWQVVYQTDFSTDPGWTTDDSNLYYWDSSDSTYFTDQVSISYGGHYAGYDAGYDGGSFLLEWDAIVYFTQYCSGFFFGLYDSDFYIQYPYCIYSVSYTHLTLPTN